MPTKTKKPKDPTTVRFPEELKQKILRESALQNRTFSAQVVTIIERHFNRKKETE